MNGRRPSRILLSQHRGSRSHHIEFFAIVNLGIVQSLASGALQPAEAVQRFYHAANCLYVRRTLRSRTASDVMSRGVQLPDLFEALDAEEAQRQFHHELQTIRKLCLRMLAKRRNPRRLSRAAA